MSKDLPWTIGRLLDWTTTYLKEKGVPDGRLDAQLMLAHALNCNKTALYMRYQEEPTEGERTRFRELVQRRAKGSPVAHLLGHKEFFSLDFEVTSDVLIPRPDSEWLVTECITLARGMSAPKILDVGTGSGCLAIALAHNLKDAVVIATDLSPLALGVAKRNAEKHKVHERVTFREGDLFAALSNEEQFDFIVSNPPYIATDVLATLAPEVRDSEPSMALDGGPDGFAIIERLLLNAPNHLKSGGHLLIEIGHDQEVQAQERFTRASHWELGKTIHDLAGHPRVLRARWTG